MFPWNPVYAAAFRPIFSKSGAIYESIPVTFPITISKCCAYFVSHRSSETRPCWNQLYKDISHFQSFLIINLSAISMQCRFRKLEPLHLELYPLQLRLTFLIFISSSNQHGFYLRYELLPTQLQFPISFSLFVRSLCHRNGGLNLVLSYVFVFLFFHFSLVDFSDLRYFWCTIRFSYSTLLRIHSSSFNFTFQVMSRLIQRQV